MKKRLSIICAAIALMASCTNAQNKEVTTTASPEAVAKTAKVVEINKEQFADLVSDYKTGTWKMKSNIPVIVDFNATWCGPCKRLAPILEELAQEYDGKIAFYSVDVDKNKPLAQAFQVRSIPMLLVCPLEGEPQQIVGLYPKEEIVNVINHVIFPDQK